MNDVLDILKKAQLKLVYNDRDESQKLIEKATRIIKNRFGDEWERFDASWKNYFGKCEIVKVNGFDNLFADTALWVAEGDADPFCGRFSR